jgi:hypothetical protein
LELRRARDGAFRGASCRSLIRSRWRARSSTSIPRQAGRRRPGQFWLASFSTSAIRLRSPLLSEPRGARIAVRSRRVRCQRDSGGAGRGGRVAPRRRRDTECAAVRGGGGTWKRRRPKRPTSVRRTGCAFSSTASRPTIVSGPPRTLHSMFAGAADVPGRGCAASRPGPCATTACEPRQGRKAAALSRPCSVPQVHRVAVGRTPLPQLPMPNFQTARRIALWNLGVAKLGITLPLACVEAFGAGPGENPADSNGRRRANRTDTSEFRE